MNKVSLLSVVVWFLINSTSAFSANLTGTYTIGATGNYTNLTAVANALKSTSGNTVTGNCTFEFLADYNTASETFPIVFKQYNASDPSYRVTIRPQNGVGSVLTSGSSNTAIISMDSADYYIFDGRAGGSGSSVWTIRNTRSSSTYGPVIRLLNGATNNTFTYIIVESQNAATNSGNIYFQGTTNTTANSNNTISYCKIRNRSDVAGTYHTNGIYASGNTAYQNSGNIIDNCEFFNHFNAASTTYAVYIYSGNTDFTISNNKIYQPDTLTFTTGNYHMSIRINNASGNNFTIENNTIGFSSNSGTGVYAIKGAVASIFCPIYLTVGTSTSSNVQGNRISGIYLSTTSTSNSGYGIFSAIYITAGKVNIGNTSANYIGDSTTADGIVISKNSTSTSVTQINGIKSASTSTLEIKNNSISGFTFTSTDATSFLNFNGISTSGTAGNYTIENNTIGSFTDAHNIQTGISSSTTGGGRILAITNSATGTVHINNNNICNITNYCTGNEYFMAIYSTSGLGNINGNIIFDLHSYSSRTGNVTSPAIGGIIKSSTIAGVYKVNENSVYNLYSHDASAAVYATGIYYGGPITAGQEIIKNRIYNLNLVSSSTTAYVYGMYINSGSGDLSQNYIHSLSAASSSANIVGLRIYGGDFSIVNNRIRLGIDATGSSITAAVNIYGIYKSNSLTNNVYYNSIYIGGTGVGSTAINTIGFYRSVNTTVDNIKNNIIVNNRSNSTTGGKHYCYVLNGTNTASFDYNVYYFNGTGGYLASLNNGTTGRSTIITLRENFSGQDLHSAVGNPNFVNITGDASALDMNVSGTTPVEGSGTSISGISVDYNGDTRASYSAVDIGSDAGNFTASDIFTPNISYTSLSNTTSLTNRDLTNVSITDIGTGVPTVGTNRPTVWYRISSGTPTAWVSNAGTINSGDSLSGTWTFTLDYSKLSRSIASGDVIQYYVVAQDQASGANIWYEPFIGASHSSVSSQTTAPTTPKSFTITGTGLSGTYTIGTGGDYTTLTAATTGFFAVANANTISGNVTLEIISNITETGAVSLNPLSMGGHSYSITIVPSAASERVISGSVSTALIKLNGADSIYINGNFSGSGRYLRFRNTNTTSGTGAISFANGSCYNKVENCILEGGTNQYTVNFSTSTASLGNNNNLIQDNIIRDRSDASATPSYAVYSNGSATSGLENKDNTVKNNEIYNFLTAGVYLNSTGNGNNWIIDGNHFYNNLGTSPSTTQYPIYISSSNSNNLQIINNYIGGQSASCGGSAWTNSGAVNFFAIYVSAIGTTTKSTIDNNIIRNIRLSNTGAATFTGIYLNSGNVYCGNTTGNIIGSATTASSIQVDGTNTVYGIRLESGESDIKKNIIANIDQTSASAGSTYGIYVNTLSSSTIEKNQIFNIGPSTAITSANSINGIRFANTGSATAYYVYNNIISLGKNSNSTSETIYGIIYRNGTGGTVKMFYNTVYITGSVSASTYYSYCFLKDGAGNINLKNNLFFNDRTGSSSVNLAIAFTNITGTIYSDYNMMITSNSTYVGRYNSTNYSFSGWQTNSSKDASSWTETSANVTASELFNDATTGDFSIINDNPECWFLNGNGISLSEVSSDISGNSRFSSYLDGSTDIGAYEFAEAEANLPYAATQSGTIAVGNTTTYSIGGKTIATIIWKSGTALPTSIDAQYISGEYHPDVPSGSPMYGYTLLTQTGGTNFIYDLILPYNDALLGKITNPSELSIAKTEDGVTWTEYEGTANSGTKTVRIYDLNSFSQFNVIGLGDCDCNNLLPIELLNFEATKINGSIELNWTTASEENNDFFQIQRSSDLKTFVTIGQVEGNGTTSISHTYSFTDKNAEKGINYYRLLNYDYDGTLHTSKNIWIDNQNSQIQLIKNGNEITLLMNQISESNLRIDIIDNSGRLISSNLYDAEENIKIKELNTKGLFYLRILYNNDIQTFKIINM